MKSLTKLISLASLLPGIFLALLLPNSQLFAEPVVVHQEATTATADYKIKAETLLKELSHPWGFTWLKPGIITADSYQEPSLLITERDGWVWLVQGRKLYQIKGLPHDLVQGGQGGWLDVLTYKKFVYLSYSKRSGLGRTTALVRFQLGKRNDQIIVHNLQPWFEMYPHIDTYLHFGGKLTRDDDAIYLSLGDRGKRHQAQNLDSHVGSIVRLPLGKGFQKVHTVKSGKRFPLKEVYSIGHRNVQGLFYDESRQLLFATEHGPQGGDELNIIDMGRNYGWPIISYGKEYGSGVPVSEITEHEGMEQPLKYWDPSPALSGLTVYNGKEFPGWQGDLLLGSLKFQRIYRLKLDENINIIETEEMFKNTFGRIRTVRMFNNELYLLTDDKNGRLIRLSKVD